MSARRQKSKNRVIVLMDDDLLAEIVSLEIPATSMAEKLRTVLQWGVDSANEARNENAQRPRSDTCRKCRTI